MNCLHICNDFFGSKVHRNLYGELAKIGIKQLVYCPIKKFKYNLFENYLVDGPLPIAGSKPLKKYHSLFFRKKINFLYEDITAQLDPSNFDIIHATTLYSDGALALKIHKAYGTPYMVAIRATDIHMFMKFKPELFSLAKEILFNAKQLIFVSESLRNNFLSHKKIKGISNEIAHKTQVIYNGMDSFWFENIKTKKPAELAPRIIYVGRIVKNKNIIRLLKAVLLLQKEIQGIHLTIVGYGNEKLKKQIIDYMEKFPKTISFEGQITDRESLAKAYGEHGIFAMPSFAETFGLVYLEAMTQGLPVLLSENSGIDGIFKTYIGSVVNPYSIASITDGLREIIELYGTFTASTIDFSPFNWSKIALRYSNIYNENVG